jgi:hypothetical protein
MSSDKGTSSHGADAPWLDSCDEHRNDGEMGNSAACIDGPKLRNQMPACQFVFSWVQRERITAMLKSLSAAVSGIEIDPQQGGMSLADFEWRYRVVIIFPDDSHIEAARQANQLLAEADGLRERDMIVLEVGRNDVKALYGPEYDLNCYAIRSDLDVMDGFFTMMLVGKDGAVKFRSDEVVPAAVLFELIDQMPLAQKKRSN